MNVELNNWIAIAANDFQLAFNDAWKEKYGDKYPEWFQVNVQIKPVKSWNGGNEIIKDDDFETFIMTENMIHIKLLKEDEKK